MTASRETTRDWVRIDVPAKVAGAPGTRPRRVRAGPGIRGRPAITAAGIAAEHHKGADYVQVTVVLSVEATDALAIAWDTFRAATGDDPAGREVTAAAAEVRPEPQLASDDASNRAARSTEVLHDRQNQAQGTGASIAM